MRKRALALLMTLCMVLSLVTPALAAEETEGKTLTVDAAATGEGAYTTIQEAIDYIDDQSDKTGWTITVASGEYDRFTVLNGLDNLTVQAAEGAMVTINVTNNSSAPTTTSGGFPDTAGVSIREANGVKLYGLTFNLGTQSTPWYSAAVSNYSESEVKGNDFTVANCTFKGSSIATNLGVFINTGTTKWSVTDCTFSELKEGISMYGDGTLLENATVTDNTFTNCSFALHGYYGGTGDAGTLTFANNTVTGSDSLRSKIVIQDQTNTGAIKVDIKENTLNNAVVGLVNLREDGETVSPVLTSNTFENGSFYVEAVEPGTIDFYTSYQAPNEEGYWKLTGNGADWTKEEQRHIQNLVDAANASGSKTLSISGIEPDQLIKTFTWFKDALYWVTNGDEEPYDPELPEVVVPEGGDGGQVENSVEINKTAEPLTDGKTDVTLSVGGSQAVENVAVLFVLDKSTSTDVRNAAAEMLTELASKENANILYDVVVFSGTAQSTGWKNIANDADLDETKNSFVNPEGTSGTNMSAGLWKAMQDLESTEIEGYETYLINLSDGITYVWTDETTGTTMSAPIVSIADNGLSVHYDAGTTTSWDIMYGLGLGVNGETADNLSPDAMNTFMSGIVQKIKSTYQDFTILPFDVASRISTDSTDRGYLTSHFLTLNNADQEGWASAKEKYACSAEIAIYYAVAYYTQLLDKVDHSYSFAVPESDTSSSWNLFPWGQQLMLYLKDMSSNSDWESGIMYNNSAGDVFSQIKDDILYAIQSGKVTDVIGTDFDLTDKGSISEDTFTLTVGGEKQIATVSGNTVNFGTADENDAYPYSVTYYPNGVDGDDREQFVWTINVPVESANGLALSYNLTLVNKSEEPGTYEVPTNENAILQYTPTVGDSGTEEFPIPKVEYSVEETGILTVQKLVPESVKDWSFDFQVTIGGQTQTISLSDEQPSQTFSNIPFGTEYSVTETEQDGYTVTYVNCEGTVSQETPNQVATVINTPKAVDTGVLVISKTVEGQKNPTEKFTFTVTLPQGKYPYTYSTAQGNAQISGSIENNGTVTLTSGQSVAIYGLPVNGAYTVTEAANDDYTISAEAIYGTVQGATVSGTIPDPDSGAAAAHYTNTYHGSWIPPVDPDPTPDPDPGDKPELNTEDHYAYIVGYEDGSVQPEGDITRAEVATIFFRLLTDESRDAFWSQTNNYPDVSEDAWYNNAVSTLTNAGILDGYEDGTFKPDGNITRAEFATIAVRFFEATYDGEDLFSDIAGHWAQDYINEAANAGIVDGYPDGTFRPQQLITRAEAMTMVNRTIDRHPHKDHLLDDMIVWPDNPETAWYYEQVQEATNSHEYTMNTDDEQNPYEIWTELLPNRDWSELEKAWSDANDGAGSGEVV